MPKINIDQLSNHIGQLNNLKKVEKVISQNNKSKGHCEDDMQKAKEKLHEIDKAMDTLIESTIDLLSQTKTLYETYDNDYVNKFSRE